jgi:hypothetical protein
MSSRAVRTQVCSESERYLKEDDDLIRLSLKKPVRQNEITLERINSVWTGEHPDKTLLGSRTETTQNTALAQGQALTDSLQKMVRRVHTGSVPRRDREGDRGLARRIYGH